jgi:hypothetical protein
MVRNLSDEREGLAIADELLRARLDARDRLLAPLVCARDAALHATPNLCQRVLRFVDLALAADRCLDRSFWLLAAANEINGATRLTARRLSSSSPRRIHTTHRVRYRERLEAVRVIVGKVTPLD